MYPSAVPTSISSADVAVADREVTGPANVSFGGLRQERVPISTWAAEKDGNVFSNKCEMKGFSCDMNAVKAEDADASGNATAPLREGKRRVRKARKKRASLTRGQMQDCPLSGVLDSSGCGPLVLLYPQVRNHGFETCV